MSFMKWNSAAQRAFLGVAVLLTASTNAFATTTTLICNLSADNAAGPGTVELNEAADSITVYDPPCHRRGETDPMPGRLQGTYAAKFDTDTITFVDGSGESITVNRLTGIFVQNGVTWTCHVGKAQF